MAFWWNNMAGGWKDYFSQGILIYDTLPFSNIVSFNDSSIVAYNWSDNIVADTFVINENDTLAFEGIADSLIRENNYFVKNTFIF